jgi:hypothetical protein
MPLRSPFLARVIWKANVLLTKAVPSPGRSEEKSHRTREMLKLG